MTIHIQLESDPSVPSVITAPGAATGDVLTVQSDGEVIPAPSGGSQPVPKWFQFAFEVGALIDPWQAYGFDGYVPISADPSISDGSIVYTAAAAPGVATMGGVVLSSIFIYAGGLIVGDSVASPLGGSEDILVWLISNPTIWCKVHLSNAPTLTQASPSYTFAQADLSISSQSAAHFSLGSGGANGQILTDTAGFYQGTVYLGTPDGVTLA